MRTGQCLHLNHTQMHADQMTATRIEKGTTEEPGWEQGDPTAVIPEVPRPVVGDAVPGQLSDSVDKGSSAVNQTDHCAMGRHAVPLSLGMDGRSRNQHATQIPMSE